MLLLPPPKGKFDPTKSKSTAISRAPKPISKQPHIPLEMCYTFTQTEVVYTGWPISHFTFQKLNNFFLNDYI